MKVVVLVAVLGGVLFAQAKIANSSFEQGELGSAPAGWFIPPVVEKAGFGLKLVDQGCRSGRCAMLTGTLNPPPNMFGNMIQSVSSNGYTLRRIRLRAAIRVEGSLTRSQMWLRLDRADNSMAFLENMSSRPVTSSEWKTYDIETQVPEDVSRIVLGVMLFGPGSAWVDDVSLDVLDEVHKDKAEPARPLTPRGLTNLTAFARLYGYVRHFHPSDQAARTDWETLAIEGARQVEGAVSNAELIERLRKQFEPIAPSVQVFATGRPKPTVIVIEPTAEVIRYVHHGVGLPTSTISMNPYSSERKKFPSKGRSLPAPFEADLVTGVQVSMPLALYVDSGGTLPHAPMPGPSLLYDRSAQDRGTRLGSVIIAWNVFQHFYPYFDVVKSDWPAELSRALRASASDAGPAEFERTLRRLVAAAKDGHGRVSAGQMPGLQPPVTFGWVQGQLLVARVQAGEAEGVAPGDRILKIDGKPIERASADTMALISGATDGWIRYRAVTELSRCDPVSKKMTLELEPYARLGTAKSMELNCVAPSFKDAESYPEPRPNTITELEPGILYVDLDRVTDAEWAGVVPRLEKAKGIIFDMRGYPGKPGLDALAHLTDNPIRSAKWNIGSAAMPDRLDTTFNESGWPVPPQKPYLTAKRAFLIDGRAISYAETVMGMVEAFKLGEIVGEPTAGTNGNVNPFRLPGGFTISWTGMKVLKHDGSQHHGIGILPTVPASRTRKGVAEGRDEILLKALEVVK